jgi:hypothetical protein
MASTLTQAANLLKELAHSTFTVTVSKGKITVRETFYYYANRDLHAFHDKFTTGYIFAYVQERLGVSLVAAGEIDPDTGKPYGAEVVEKKNGGHYEIKLALAA